MLLRERGIEPLVEPMLTIALLPDPNLDLSGGQAILFTSANGVRAFVAGSKERAIPVFAVGDATAAAARAAGFATVVSAGGDVGDLAQLVRARLNPESGPLVHVAGSQVAGDLASILTQQGFTVRRAVMYEARPATTLSKTVAAALRNNTIDMVLFFSPRTAATFVTLMRKGELDSACRNMAAFCLSPAVAKTAQELSWREVRCAARPELRALIDEIDAALR